MTRIEDRCPYCDTEFLVEFEDDDDVVTFCPCCGEELPEDLEEDFEDFYEEYDE